MHGYRRTHKICTPLDEWFYNFAVFAHQNNYSLNIFELSKALRWKFISRNIFRTAISIFHYSHSLYYVFTTFPIEMTKICSVYMFKSVCVIKARLRKVKYQLIKNKQANSPSSFHSIYQSAFTFYLFLRTLSSTMKNTIVFMTLDISRIKCHQGRKQKFLAHQILFKSSNFYSNVKLPEIIVTPLLRHFLFELK